MSVDERDWERLNALHDGELTAEEAAALRARLDNEPELRAEFEAIAIMSGALAQMRPGLVADVAPPPAAPRRSGRMIAALAACVMLAVGTGIAIMPQADAAPGSPLEWHDAFRDRSYATDQVAGMELPVGKLIGGEPDLSAANLTLVDVATADGGDVFLHYSGVNGCRLTFGAHASMPDMPRADGGLLVHGWSVGDIHYSLLAVGMDRGKFGGIVAVLEDFTTPRNETFEAVAALKTATETALPCA